MANVPPQLRNKPPQLQVDAPVSESVPFRTGKYFELQRLTNQAAQREAQEQMARDQRIAGIREQIGPVGAGTIAGVNELYQPLMGAGMLATGVGPEPWAPGAKAAIQEESQEWEEKTRALREAYPTATTIGQTIPYLGTGYGAHIAYFKGASRLAPGVKRDILTGPMASSVIPGAVEGGLMAGLNPYQSGPTGALLGAGGSYLGQRATMPLAKSPTNLSNYDQGMLDIAKDWNITGHPNKTIYDYMMAGAKTGNLAFKEFDQAVMKNPKAVSAVEHRISVPQKELNRRVFGVAGLDAEDLTPTGLYEHQRALGKQYDALEGQATPVFSQDHFNALESANQKFLDRRGITKSPLVSEIMREFPMHNISLTQYRHMKNLLNQKIRNLEGGPVDPDMYDRLTYLKEVKKTLQNTLRSQDAGVDAQLRDLDSKYAAATFLETKGIIKDGDVDFKKLYSEMYNRNPKDLVSLSGPWSDMAKAASLGKYIEDSRSVGTLAKHRELGQFLAPRERRLGAFGRITDILTDKSPILPRSAMQLMEYSYPRKGLARLPQASPILAGAPIGSAAARGSGLMGR